MEEKIIKKLSDYETHKVTPYTLEGIEEKSVYTKTDVDVVISTTTGEFMELKKASEKKTYMNDTLPYAKVYQNSLVTVKDFTIPALKVWCYILKNLKPCSHIIELDMEEVKVFTGYDGVSNIYSGLAYLLDKDFIARSTNSGKYWINPNKMFNGKRVTN